MSLPRAFVEVARTAQVLAQAPASLDWLSASERARLATMSHAGRREHYLAGHWLARVLLARAFGEVSTGWSLLERRSLPPLVDRYEDALFVSLSHSGQWVGAAVAEVPIGIDIEQSGRVLDASIEPLLLEPGEARGAVGAEALLQRWVAKEAWLKRGAGNALPEQLARMRLHDAVGAPADVQVACHAEFHLGLAVADECALDLRSEGAFGEGRRFGIAVA